MAVALSWDTLLLTPGHLECVRAGSLPDLCPDLTVNWEKGKWVASRVSKNPEP